jgi:hypothetical protein
MTDFSYSQTWKEQFPALWNEISAATDRKELNAIMRNVMKKFDADIYPSNSAGAIEAFKREMKEQTEVEYNINRSAEDRRVARILDSGRRDSRGRTIARTF